MIYIKTLGEFDIQRDGKSMLLDVKYPYRLVKLFKYLLTFHDKKLTPETIVVDLLGDNDFQDPKRVLRTQISRLRKFLIYSADMGGYFNIYFSHGYYIFNINNEKCELDVEVFEDKIKIGNFLKNEEPLKSIEIYSEAIAIYKGKYLNEMEYEDWIIPLRNKYERLFLQVLFRNIELLDKYHRYNDIIEICENALILEPYDENLNIYFIEALLNIGEQNYAFSHYEYMTSRLYKELNIVPSDNVKKLYKKMLNRISIRENIEIPYIDEILKYELKKEGAFQCELDYFSFLYNLEKKRSIRDRETNKFIGIITILSSKNVEFSNSHFLKLIKVLEKVLFYSLREGDVFSIWNDRQAVFMLTNIEHKDLHIVEERIVKNFNSLNQDKANYLKIKIKSISEE